MKLEDMQKTEYAFSSPYVKDLPMVRYEKVFTSGHKLIIDQLMNNHFILTFYGLNDSGGEITGATAEQCLKEFNTLFNDNGIRRDLMCGFEY